MDTATAEALGRECYVCKSRKEMEDFPLCKLTKGGRRRICRTCDSAVRRKRSKTIAGRAASRRNSERARATPQGKVRQRAKSKVGAAVQGGRLQRAGAQPCEMAGPACKGRHEWHHDSYLEADWLAVRCLCAGHHKDWHRAQEPVYPGGSL